MEYLTYVKYLSIKGTRFHTKSILAFDEEYRATKAREDFPWGTNVDDLSSQYLDALVSHRAWQQPHRHIEVIAIPAVKQPLTKYVFTGISVLMVALTPHRVATTMCVFLVSLPHIEDRVVAVVHARILNHPPQL